MKKKTIGVSEKDKLWRDSNHLSLVLNYPTPPDPTFSDVHIGDAFQFINHISQRRDKKLQVGVASGKALAFKTVGRGFAPPRVVFFMHRRRRRLSIYKSYIAEKRDETTGMSGVGVTLAFKCRDRRVDSRQCFFFFRQRRFKV